MAIFLLLKFKSQQCETNDTEFNLLRMKHHLAKRSPRVICQ